MSSNKKRSGPPAAKVDNDGQADQAGRDHAADMEAAKQALARVAAEREARAEALRQVSSGGKGGSKVSGRGGRRNAGSKTTSVTKSGDR